MTVLVAGGAGFIGGHLVHRLLTGSNQQVVVYDNLSSGTLQHLEPHLHEPRLRIVEADLKDQATLTEAMQGVDTVYHLASNPNIALAATQPDVDFWEGTYLTNNILEAMRANRVGKIIYASGSGVYGDAGSVAVGEDYSPMRPISTYAASKLAGESMICAYCHLFEMAGRVYRFANVVGPRQTHGVGFDFIRRLRQEPLHLEILGDGKQSKSYIYVDDVLDAIDWTSKRMTECFDVFNVATDDTITVTEIACLAIELSGRSPESVELHYTGGPRGWKGDVPVVRFDLAKIHATGWRAGRNSYQAVRDSLQAMLSEISQVGSYGNLV